MKQLIAIIIAVSFIFVGFLPSVVAEIDNVVIERVVGSVMLVRGPSGQGSGVVVNITNAKTNNYMLTAYHVINNSSGIDEMTLILITDRNGNEYKAEVYMTDKANDLALLRLLVGEFPVKPVKIAKPNQYEIGDEIFTVGYNLQGFEEGEQDGLNPKDNVTKNPIPRVGFGNISDIRPKLIYIDVGCYSWGSSGGGTFTEKGKLIGINSLGLYDGAGKLGGIRPVAELNFDVIAPVDAKKKITDITNRDKRKAIMEAVEGDAGYPAYYYRYSPVYMKRIVLTDHYIFEEDVDKEFYDLWTDAGRPDRWVLIYSVGPSVGLYIEEHRLWSHDEDGYERQALTVCVGVSQNWRWDNEKEGKGHWEYGDLTLWSEPTKAYIVCSERGVILNTHGGSWYQPFPEEEALIIAHRWFDYIWQIRCAPHFVGGE